MTNWFCFAWIKLWGRYDLSLIQVLTSLFTAFVKTSVAPWLAMCWVACETLEALLFLPSMSGPKVHCDGDTSGKKVSCSIQLLCLFFFDEEPVRYIFNYSSWVVFRESIISVKWPSNLPATKWCSWLNARHHTWWGFDSRSSHTSRSTWKTALAGAATVSLPMAPQTIRTAPKVVCKPNWSSKLLVGGCTWLRR